MNIAHQRGMSEGYSRGRIIQEARENETKQTESYHDEYETEPLADSIPQLNYVSDNLKQDESSSQSLRAHIEESNDHFYNGYQEGMMMLMLDQDEDNSSNEFAKKSQWLGGENPVIWVQKQLHEQYFESFNFYFAKGINEILANINISHVILFKDYLFLDDDSEYLKRYYFKQEVPPRFNLLADFYTNQYKQTRPNLCTIGPAKIITKRNYKLAKLFVKNQERLFKIMNGQDPNQGGNEDEEGNVLGQSQREEESALGRGKRRLTNLLDDLDQPTKNSSVQDTQTFSSQNIQLQTNEDNEVSGRDDSNSEEISFESKSHDIYYPSFSSNGDNQNDAKHNSTTQKSIQKRVQQFILPQDISLSNVNIRPRGQFMVSRQKVIEKYVSQEFQDQEQQQQQIRIVQYNELSDIEKYLPNHLQIYLTQDLSEKDDTLKERESSSKKQTGSDLKKSSESSQLPIKRIKPLTIKSSYEESRSDKFIGQEGAAGSAVVSSSSSLAPNTARTTGSTRHREDNIIVTSSGISLTQPGSSAAIRGALLAEYLSQENPLSCRATSKTLQNNQFSRAAGQQQQLQELIMQAQQAHQPEKSSILNRLPESMKQQLTLNLQENDKFVRNIIVSQHKSQPSPDRIWTDRDVNPRPSAHPENQNLHSTGSTTFQLRELSHSLATQIHNNQLENSNLNNQKPLGALSEKKQLLAKITEETAQQHTHPAITSILLTALAKSNSHHHHLQHQNGESKTTNNSRNISSNPTRQMLNNPNSTNATQNNTNNQNPFSSANNSNIHNNSSSNGSNKGVSQIAMQSKIISNTVSNSTTKISSQTSNVQDVYKKYQQMKINEEQGMLQSQQQQIFSGRVSQEFQSFRPSGSSNSLHSFQNMPFFKTNRNTAGEDNNRQDINLQMINKNVKLLSDPLVGTVKIIGQQQQQIMIQPQPIQKKNQQFQSQQIPQLHELQSFSEGQFILSGNQTEQTGGVSTRLGNTAKMNAVIAKAASHGVSNSQTFRVSSPNNLSSQQKQIKINKVRGNKSTTITCGGGSKTLRNSSLIKNLSGDELGIIINSNNNNINSHHKLADSPNFKSQRQTPIAQARKTPSSSSQNDKIFFTSVNNQNIILPSKSTHPASTKNTNSKTIHIANNYVSPSNPRMTPRSTGNGQSSKQLSSGTIPPPHAASHRSYQDSHKASLERNRHGQQQNQHFSQTENTSDNTNNNQLLTKGVIDLNNLNSNMNSPLNQQNTEKYNDTNSIIYQNKQQNHRSENNSNTSNNCNNLASSINIHNINNNININNINVPQKSSSSSQQQYSQLPVNTLNVNQKNIANFIQNQSQNQLQAKDTQQTQGNQYSKQQGSQSVNQPISLHIKQKSENLQRGTENTAPTHGGTGSARVIFPIDQKSPRTNNLNLPDTQLLQQQHKVQEEQQLTVENQASLQQRKQDFKLNISKIINQQQEQTQNICSGTNNNNTERNPSSASSRITNRTANKGSTFQFLNEDNQENSYGFWTSRSSKQGQQSKQLQQQSTYQGYSSANSVNSLKCSSLTASKSSNNNTNNNMVNQGKDNNVKSRNNQVKIESQPASSNANNQQVISAINYPRTNSVPQIHHTFGAFSERGPGYKSPVHSQKQDLLLKPSPQLGKQLNNNNVNSNDIPRGSPQQQQQVINNVNIGKKSQNFVEDLLGQKKSISSVQSTIQQTVEMNINEYQNKPSKQINQQTQNQFQQHPMPQQQSNNKLNK